MRVWLKTFVAMVGLLTGCRAHAPTPAPRQPIPTIGPVTAELPLARASQIEPDLRSLAQTAVRTVSASEETEYRLLSEATCQRLAARNSAPANALDDEG